MAMETKIVTAVPHFSFEHIKKSDFSNEETLLRKTVTGVTNQRCA